MQRTGRKGHAQFRVVVQDSRRTPTSGKIVAAIGHYNPHNKEIVIDKEKASFYMEHGAQPSERVARMFKSEGVKMPAWVVVSADKNRTIRNSDKLRKNRPAEPKSAAPEPEADAPVDAETEAVASESEPTTDETTTVTPDEVAEQTEVADAETSDETPVESAS